MTLTNANVSNSSFGNPIAKQNITTNVNFNVPAIQYKMKAGNTVFLDRNFSVERGANFSVEMGTVSDCNDD